MTVTTSAQHRESACGMLSFGMDRVCSGVSRRFALPCGWKPKGPSSGRSSAPPSIRRVIADRTSSCTSGSGVDVDVALLGTPFTHLAIVRVSITAPTGAGSGDTNVPVIQSLRSLTGTGAEARDAVSLPFPPRDVQWCPYRHTDSDADALITACRASPVLLVDAADGSLRGTYRAYNAMDELVAPYSLLWSSRLSCGVSHVIAGFGGELAEVGAGLTAASIDSDGSAVTAAHLRCFDVVREGRDAVWGYQSKLVGRRSDAIVSALFELSPSFAHLVGVGWSGISPAHGELVDVRHRGVAAAMPVHQAVASTGMTCGKPHPSDPHRFFTRLRVTGSSVVAEWDIRRMGAPAAMHTWVSTNHADGLSLAVPTAFDVVEACGQTFVIHGATEEAEGRPTALHTSSTDSSGLRVPLPSISPSPSPTTTTRIREALTLLPTGGNVGSPPVLLVAGFADRVAEKRLTNGEARFHGEDDEDDDDDDVCPASGVSCAGLDVHVGAVTL